MRKCKFLTLFVGILITTNVFAQFDNVNLFTGTPEITIPITTIALNDFALPISLNYAGVGIKVADRAPWTGLGWNLQTGGSITRIQRGQIDDVNYDDNLSNDDNQPDIFKYSFGNKSGSFVINSDNTCDLVPFNNIRITPVIETVGTGKKLSGFIIYDDDGTIYQFLVGEYYTIKTLCYVCDDYSFSDYETFPHCVHTSPYWRSNSTNNYFWQLAKIITNKNDYIYFNYAEENIQVYSKSTEISILVGQRLKNITTANEIVEFNVDESPLGLREDDPTTRYLDNILIKRIMPVSNEIIKGYKFKYSYDVSMNGVVLGTTADYKRLMLDELYEHDGTYNNKIPAFIFGYFADHKMPDLGSKAQDFWGYYNGKDAATNLKPTIYIYPGEPNDPYRVLPIPSYNGTFYTKIGADRTPKKDYMNALMLTSLKTPMGAIYNYTYEPHTYIYQKNEYTGGGVRIHEISVSGITSPTSTIYNYLDYDNGGISSGKLLGIPIFAKRGLENYPSGVDPSTLDESKKYDYTTEVSEKSYVDFGEVGIVYSTVEVSKNANGKSRFSYQVPFTFNENNEAHSSLVTEPTDPIKLADNNVECDECIGTSYNNTRNAWFKRVGPIINNYNVYPFPPKTNYKWDYGQLLNEIDFDNAGNPVRQVTKKYNTFYANGNSAKDLNVSFKSKTRYLYDHHECITCCLTKTHCAFEKRYPDERNYEDLETLNSTYHVLTGVAKKLSSTIETIYNSTGDSITNLTDYNYNRFGQISSVSQTKSNDIINKITYKYPFDYPQSSCELEKQVCLSAAVTKRDQMFAYCNTETNNESDKATCISAYTSMYNSDVDQCQDYFVNCNRALATDQHIISEMENKNMISSVIEEQHSQIKNTTTSITGGIINKFTKQNGLIVPGEKYSLELNNPSSDITASSINTSGALIFHPGYSKILTYDKYDAKGNILQYHKSDDINTAFLWSYNASMPVIKADNVTYDILNTAVIAATGATDLETFWSGFNDIATNASQQAAWKTFNTALRSNASLANAQITTYTYKPLVGITSQTDPNSITTYSDYDDFGRLNLVKDKDKNILKTYDYNYKQ